MIKKTQAMIELGKCRVVPLIELRGGFFNPFSPAHCFIFLVFVYYYIFSLFEKNYQDHAIQILFDSRRNKLKLRWTAIKVHVIKMIFI